MTDLTPTALALCATHYRTGCGRCPIQAACHSGCTPLTVATFAAWQAKLDAYRAATLAQDTAINAARTGSTT